MSATPDESPQVTTATSSSSSPGISSEVIADVAEPTSSTSTIAGESSNGGVIEAAAIAPTSNEAEKPGSESGGAATVHPSNSEPEHTAVAPEEPHVAGGVADDSIKLSNAASDTNEGNVSQPAVVHVDNIESPSAPGAGDSSPVVAIAEHENTRQVTEQSLPADSDSGVPMVERSAESRDHDSFTIAAERGPGSTDGAAAIGQEVGEDQAESADPQSEHIPRDNETGTGTLHAAADHPESSAEEVSIVVESPAAESASASQPAAAAAAAAAASTVTIAKLKPREQLREALLQFYTKYKPQKRGVVDQIVDKYEHDQATLFDQLERLYDAVPKLYSHRRLFVGQLPSEVTDGDLRVYFSRFGKLGETGVVKRHNRSRRFGYVQFEKAEASVKCLSHRNHSLRGKPITVQEAKPIGAGPSDADIAEQVSKRPASPPAAGSKTSHEAAQDSRTPTKRGRGGQPEPQKSPKSPAPSPSGEPPPPPRKFFLGGITKSTTQHDIRAYFQRFGPVADAVAMSHRSFGFVTMGDDGSARAVLAAERHVINGRVIDLRKADDRPHPYEGKGGASSSSHANVGGSGARQQPHETRSDKEVAGPRLLTHGRPDDWVCPACSNVNFARRTECNRCHRAKSPPRASDDAGRVPRPPPRKRRASRSRSVSRERRRYSDEGSRRSDNQHHRRNRDGEDFPSANNNFQRNHPRNRAGGAPPLLLPHGHGGVGHPAGGAGGGDPREHHHHHHHHLRPAEDYRRLDHSNRFGASSSHRQPPPGDSPYFSPDNPPPPVYTHGRDAGSYGPSAPPSPAEPLRYASRAVSSAHPEPYYYDDERRRAYKPRSRSRSRSRDRDTRSSHSNGGRGRGRGRGRSPPRQYRREDPAHLEPPPRSRDYPPTHREYAFPSADTSRRLPSAPPMYEHGGRQGPSAHHRPPSPPPEDRYPLPSHSRGERVASISGRGYSPPRDDLQHRSGNNNNRFRDSSSPYDPSHGSRGGGRVAERSDFSRPPISGPPSYGTPGPPFGASRSAYPLSSGLPQGQQQQPPQQQRDRSFGPSGGGGGGGHLQSDYRSEFRPLRREIPAAAGNRAGRMMDGAGPRSFGSAPPPQSMYNSSSSSSSSSTRSYRGEPPAPFAAGPMGGGPRGGPPPPSGPRQRGSQPYRSAPPPHFR